MTKQCLRSNELKAVNPPFAAPAHSPLVRVATDAIADGICPLLGCRSPTSACSKRLGKQRRLDECQDEKESPAVIISQKSRNA